MFLIVFGALIGAVFGGLSGLLIGGLLGYAANYLLARTVIGGIQIAQNQLIDSTFSVMGALCKADNVVTRDEIAAVEQMFRMLNLDS